VRTFSCEAGYPNPPSTLLALWRDPDFLAALGARFGGVGQPRVEQDGDRVLVHTQRKLPLDKVPGFLRRFISSGLLEQVDDWPSEAGPTDGPIEGAWTVTGKMPATMSGRHSIRSDGNGCVVEVHGDVKVNVPLVAGKAEDLIANQITTLIQRQQEFAADWLAGKVSQEDAGGSAGA
jgi:hypothetical protein